MIFGIYEQLAKAWFLDKNHFKQQALDLIKADQEINLAKSYVHENGFRKVTLLEAEDKSLALRLHVWKDVSVESNIHSHCFDLTSTVLTGSVEDKVFVEREDGVEIQKFLYNRRGTRKAYSLQSLGSAKLSVVERRLYGPGDRYGHKFDRLHSSKPMASEVVTLFIADRRHAPDTALVYANRYSPDGQEVLSPPIGMAEVKEIISSLS